MNTIFKQRKHKEKFEWSGKVYETIQYQCPICKRWFTSYTQNTGGLLQHITIIGKREVIARELGEVKKIPHFQFWKKYTKPSDIFYKPRYWTL
jgi:hypothetical protein